MFQAKVVEKITTHILCSILFFRKSCRLWDNLENYCRAGQTTGTIWCIHIAFWTPNATNTYSDYVEVSWNVMVQALKPDFVFRRNGRIHLNRRGRQFSRLLTVEVCASTVVMLDTPCSEVVWKVLATHSIRQFPLHFPSRASPWSITFQLESTNCFCTVTIVARTRLIVTLYVYCLPC